MSKRGRWVLLLCVAACTKRPAAPPRHDKQAAPAPARRPPRPPMPWDKGGALAPGQTFVLAGGRATIEEARAHKLLDVDLGDDWAPFLFSDGEGEPGGNFYRPTFVALAGNKTTPHELFLESPEGRRAVLAAANVPRVKKGQPPPPEEKKALDAARRALHSERARNFLEPYGIAPTLSVLRARLAEDRGKSCFDKIDVAALAAYDGIVSYSNRERARRDYNEAQSDAVWAEKVQAPRPDGGVMPTSVLPPSMAQPRAHDEAKTAARLERARRGQLRVAAVRATQARLQCEGLLSPRARFVDGMFDLATHEALADFEKKNDIFGWGFLGGETTAALQRPPLLAHLETFKRIAAERLADAAGIVEDGSVAAGKKPATYKDASGAVHEVPNLIGQHVAALLAALHVQSPEDLAELFDSLPLGANLHVAFIPPPLPPYYAKEMDLSVEIDRGDVWYDFPWDAQGKPVEQRRLRFPGLTLYTTWARQKIPLARWRTTIGSWRSELHGDGKVYYKYKNSDVGPRIWKNIVAAPVWIPPDGTPAKDLLTRRVFDANVGPVPVVNSEVMGPGFGSAYGLGMAIHLKVMPGGGLFDNQIRTHGSVDYTSIGGRFSHGCHRLVNNRAVRLFDFVLEHRRFARLGNQKLVGYKKQFVVDDKSFEYDLATRGYYYDLIPPVPVTVAEGHIMGKQQKPITEYVRKPGVDYGESPESTVETAPVVGP